MVPVALVFVWRGARGTVSSSESTIFTRVIWWVLGWAPYVGYTVECHGSPITTASGELTSVAVAGSCDATDCGGSDSSTASARRLVSATRPVTRRSHPDISGC